MSIGIGLAVDTNNLPEVKFPKVLTNYAKMDGLTSHIRIPNKSSIQPTNKVTIMFDFMAESLSTDTTAIGLLTKRTSSSDGLFIFYYTATTNSLTIDFGGSGTRWVLGWTPQLNREYTFALTFDGTTATVYIDGVSLGTKTGLVDASTINDLYVGANENGSMYRLQGYVKNLSFWGRALTPTEVKKYDSKELTGKEYGLKAYYPISEGKGSVSTDKVSGTADANHNATTWLDKGLAFNGSATSMVTLSNDALFNQQKLSIEFWMSVNDTVLSYKNFVAKEIGYKIRAYGTNIQVLGSTTGTGWTFQPIFTANLQPNTVYHVVLTIDFIAGKCEVFLDGVSLGAQTFTGAVPAFNGNSLYFATYNSAGSESLNGNLYLVRMYNRILSAGEVVQNMKNNVTRSSLTNEWLLDEGTGTTVVDNVSKKNGVINTGGTWI